MNEYVKILKRHMAENPPNYGSDANSILEMLFTYYHEYNNTDTDAVKAAFEDLYQRMRDMPLREMDRIVDAVSTLCREQVVSRVMRKFALVSGRNLLQGAA